MNSHVYVIFCSFFGKLVIIIIIYPVTQIHLQSQSVYTDNQLTHKINLSCFVGIHFYTRYENREKLLTFLPSK